MHLHASLVSFLLATAAFGQGTWVVADDGSGDFTDLQAAIDAAADGDHVLVRSGTFPQILIDGKGLTIVAEGAAGITALSLGAGVSTVRIRNTSSPQTVVLRGFSVGAIGEPAPTIDVRDTQGAVLLEDLSVTGTGSPAYLENAASVAITRSALVAPPTLAKDFLTFLGFETFPGLTAVDSRVFLHESAVWGSDGTDAFLSPFFHVVPCGPAGAGLVLSGGRALVTAGSIAGGDGGSDPSGQCEPGADGAPGLVLQAGGAGPAPLATLRGVDVFGGAGGQGGCGVGDGVDGSATAVIAGAIVELPGAGRSVSASSVVPAGGTLLFHIAGKPGDLAFLNAGLGVVPAFELPAFGLAQHIAPPFVTVPVGALKSEDPLIVGFAIPPLPAGIESTRLVSQALLLDGTSVLDGGVSVTLLVDAAL
jgi:hypothetical protein